MLIRKFYLLLILFTLFRCSNPDSGLEQKISEDSIKILPDEVIKYKKDQEKLINAKIINHETKIIYDFYNSGSLKTKTEYYGEKVVKVIDYYDTTNIIKEITDYKFIRRYKDHLPISRLKFNESGILEKDSSSFVECILTKDSVEKGEDVSVNLNLYSINNSKDILRKENMVFIGGVDDEYNIIDTLSMQIFSMPLNKLEFTLKGNNLGNNLIKGILIEKIYNKDGTAKINPYFFEISFYVKGVCDLTYPDLDFFYYVARSFKKK